MSKKKSAKPAAVKAHKPAAVKAHKPAAARATKFNIGWRSRQASTMRGHKHITAADEKTARREFESQYPDAIIDEVTK